jgi:spore coat polysaccharide biosynthesis protein SpsF
MKQKNHYMIGCIVQARMGSSRLPGKTLVKLTDELSTLNFVINQISSSTLIDKIIIATTSLEQDDIIENTCKELGIESYRGSSSDVLDRYYNCAKKFHFDHIIRITADCPLIDPEIIDKVIKKYTTEDFDYVSNTLECTFPIGTDVEIFSFPILEKTWQNAKLLSEREHVTPFIRNNKLNMKLGNLKNTKNLSHIRITLDHTEDLELIQKIISQINNRPILLNDILDLLSTQPELLKINQHIPHNEGMLKSLNQDRNFKN